MTRQKTSPLLLWAIFLIFAFSNALLSYFSWGTGVRCGVIFFGLILPFLLLARASSPEKNSGWTLPERGWPVLSAWVWTLLFLAGIFLRFYRLLDFSRWPLTDESFFGFTALRLSNHWDFQPFYSSSQVPGAFFWLLALSFKAWGASLSSLWALPEIFSALTLPMVFLAARSLFGKPFALLSTGLWAFGFWPLYQGRFCVQYSLLILWLWITLWLLGRCLEPQEERVTKRRLAVFAAVIAAGFYIAVSWILVACALTGGLTLSFRRKKNLLFHFLRWAIPLCAPFPAIVLFSYDGGYMHSLLPFQGNFPWTDYPLNLIRYGTGLLWGIPSRFTVSSYGPHWGGFLNPLLGSFFLVGLLSGGKPRERLWVWYGASLFLVLSAPAWLTSNLEFFRIVQLSPLVLGVVALGILRLFGDFSLRVKSGCLAGLLLLSGGMDVYHLFGPVSQGAVSSIIWSNKSPRYEAYWILKEKVRPRGPGFLFGRFMDNPAEANLKVACAEFDILSNPRLDPQKAAWVALVTNINRQPFLERSLPGGKVYWLSKEAPPPDGGWMLFVAPVTPSLKPLLESWRKADEALGILYESPANSNPNALMSAYPFFRGDPFLESFFWSLISRQLTNDGIIHAHRRFHPGGTWEVSSGSLPETVKDEPLLQEAVSATQKALERGYPSADLYYQMGALWSILGDGPRSRENFLKAAEAPLDFTQSKLLLGNLPASKRPERALK